MAMTEDVLLLTPSPSLTVYMSSMRYSQTGQYRRSAKNEQVHLEASISSHQFCNVKVNLTMLPCCFPQPSISIYAAHFLSIN